jgi:hypothetical protein
VCSDICIGSDPRKGGGWYLVHANRDSGQVNTVKNTPVGMLDLHLHIHEHSLTLFTSILKMEAAYTSEILTTLTKSTWCKDPTAELTSTYVGSGVLTVKTMKGTIFWDVRLCWATLHLMTENSALQHHHNLDHCKPFP